MEPFNGVWAGVGIVLLFAGVIGMRIRLNHTDAHSDFATAMGVLAVWFVFSTGTIAFSITHDANQKSEALAGIGYTLIGETDQVLIVKDEQGAIQQLVLIDLGNGNWEVAVL